MANALFTINGDDSDQGFEATPGQTLELRLKQLPVAGVSSVLYQVFSVGFEPSLGIAGNPPLQSPGAPLLTLEGATTGSAVAPVGLDGIVTCTLPEVDDVLPGADGDVTVALGHAWIIRCIVDGGFGALPDGRTGPRPELVHERLVCLRDEAGCRDIVRSETTQQTADGWALAFRELRVALVTRGGGGGDPQQVEVFRPPAAFYYDLSAATGDSDPGPGVLRFSVAGDRLFFSLTDLAGFEWTAFYSTLQRGFVRVATINDGGWMVFQILAVEIVADLYARMTVQLVQSIATIEGGQPVRCTFDVDHALAPEHTVPSIVGATTAAALDSVIAALVELGLATDGR